MSFTSPNNQGTRGWKFSIEAASLDTTNSAADDSLRSDRFLDVDKFPQLHYRSTKVHYVEADRWQIDGQLTIKGVTRPITLEEASRELCRFPATLEPSSPSSLAESSTDGTSGSTSTFPFRQGDGLSAIRFAWSSTSRPIYPRSHRARPAGP